jgi:hypothetical protein
MEQYKLTGQHPTRGMLTRFPRTPEALAEQVLRWREDQCNPICFYTWKSSCYEPGIAPDSLRLLFEHDEGATGDEADRDSGEQ